MKSVVSFFVACLMLVSGLIPQSELAELSKPPQFVAHYRFHHLAASSSLLLAQACSSPAATPVIAHPAPGVVRPRPA